MTYYVLDDLNLKPWIGIKNYVSRIPSLPSEKCFEEASGNYQDKGCQVEELESFGSEDSH